MQTIAVWLVAAMNLWVPLSDVKFQGESKENAMVRRDVIASDALRVAMDAKEEPLFQGERGREKTALFMLAIASYESGYHHKVDSGHIRGDGGISWCMMQILLPPGARTQEGWTGQELIADRTKCFRAALHALHASKRLCKWAQPADVFSAYAAGRCVVNLWAARSRYFRAVDWLKKNPVPKSVPSAYTGQEVQK